MCTFISSRTQANGSGRIHSYRPAHTAHRAIRHNPPTAVTPRAIQIPSLVQFSIRTRTFFGPRQYESGNSANFHPHQYESRLEYFSVCVSRIQNLPSRESPNITPLLTRILPRAADLPCTVRNKIGRSEVRYSHQESNWGTVFILCSTHSAKYRNGGCPSPPEWMWLWRVLSIASGPQATPKTLQFPQCCWGWRSPFQCTNCDRRFKQHRARGGPPPIHEMACQWCSFTATSLIGLRQHQRQIHSIEYNEEDEATAAAVARYGQGRDILRGL